jgi:hypothetical protein
MQVICKNNRCLAFFAIAGYGAPMIVNNRKSAETSVACWIRKVIFCSFGLGIIFMLLPTPGLTADMKRLGKFQYWEAYTEGANEALQCFIISTPQRKQPRSAKRGEVFFTISHRPSAGTFNEPAIRVGYPMTDKVMPNAEIDGMKFRFFSGTHAKSEAEEWSWLADIEQAEALIAQLKAGSLMVYSGQSKRGTATRDSYSLMGFTRALETIDKACPGDAN